MCQKGRTDMSKETYDICQKRSTSISLTKQKCSNLAYRCWLTYRCVKQSVNKSKDTNKRDIRTFLTLSLSHSPVPGGPPPPSPPPPPPPHCSPSLYLFLSISSSSFTLHSHTLPPHTYAHTQSLSHTEVIVYWLLNSVLQCVAACCSVLQYAAVGCSAL